MNKLSNIPLMNYSEFKALYESKLFEENDMDELAKKISDNVSKVSLQDSEVISTVKKITDDDLKDIKLELEEPVNEALLTIAGAVLSAGKLTSWLGNGVSWLGKKLNTKGIEHVGEWLEKGGHKYTHAIEDKLVIPALELLPAYKALPDADKKKIAKYVLIGVIGTLSVSAGFELINALKDGHGLLAAIESSLVSAKASELSHLVGEVVGDVAKGIQEMEH